MNLGGGNHIFVKLLTDEHLHGIGEAYRVGPDKAVEETVLYFKDWLIGQDPTRIEHIWGLMYNGSRFPGGSIVNAAISAIEIACWDVKGKKLGVPVYELIGGRCRDKVRVYRGISGDTPQQLADDARRAAQSEGFTAVKMAPQPPAAEKLPWNRVLRETAKRMEAVRKAVGEDVDIGLDPHARIFEPVRALQMAAVVEPFQPFFFEEPLRPENIEAMGELRQKIGIPIATGEMLYTKYEFQGCDRCWGGRHPTARSPALWGTDGDQEDCRHGRSPLFDDRSPQSTRPGFHGRLDSLRGLHPQFHHSGIPCGQPRSYAGP